MEGYINLVKEIYDFFAGDGTFILWNFIIMLFVFFLPENQRLKRYILYPSAVILFIINNPLSITLIVQSGLMSSNRYVRLYWLIPFAFMGAYLCCLLIEKGLKWRKYVLAVLCVVVIIITGKYMFTQENYMPKTNLYNLPDAVIEICDFIEEDAKRDGKEMRNARILTSSRYSPYIRQYNGEIKILFGRYVDWESPYSSMASALIQSMDEPELDVKKITDGAKETGCSYIVVEQQKPKKGKFKKNGYEKLVETGEYVIYKKEVKDEKKRKKIEND